MTLSDLHNRIPAYYPTMYLDGYSPQQILNAAHKQMYNDYIARKEASTNQAESEVLQTVISSMTFKSVVTVK